MAASRERLDSLSDEEYDGDDFGQEQDLQSMMHQFKRRRGSGAAAPSAAPAAASGVPGLPAAGAVDWDQAAADGGAREKLFAAPVQASSSAAEEEPRKNAVKDDPRMFDRLAHVSADVAESELSPEEKEKARELAEVMDLDRRNNRLIAEVFPARVVPQSVREPFHRNQMLVYTLAVQAIMLKDAQKRRVVRRRSSVGDGGGKGGGKGAAEHDDHVTAEKKRLAALELVAEAFHVSEREYQETMAAYSGESGHEILERELLKQLSYVCFDPYYNADSFGSAAVYEAWLSREKRDIRNALVSLLSPPDPPRPAVLTEAEREAEALTAAGSQRALGAKPQKQAPPKKKKKKGGLAALLGSLCGRGAGPAAGDGDKPPEQPQHRERRARADRKALEEYEAKVRKVREERERVRASVEPKCVAAEHMQQEEPIDYNEAYTTLMRVLIQYDQQPDLEHGAPMLLVERPGLRLERVRDLTPTAFDVLQRFGLLFRVGKVRQRLDYLSLLLFNLSNEADFFTLVSDTAAELNDMRLKSAELAEAKDASAMMASSPDFEPWTRDELETFEELVEEAFSWCRDCVGRYQTIFYSRFEAFQECATVMVELQDVLADLRAARGEEPGDLVSELTVAVREAQTLQYKELVSISSSKLHSLERGKAAPGAPAPGRPSPGLAALPLARNATFNVLGQILDLDQMLAVFASVEDELAQSERDEEAFELVPAFSLAAVAADNYLTLLWSDAQLFLRSETDKLENGAPFSTRLFRLNDTMGGFYAKASVLTDLPDVQPQRWFAPFMDEWLAGKRLKFTTEYLDGLIRQENWTVMTARAHYSNSVVDLFRLLTPISSAFKKMPYTGEHCKAFAELVTRAVQQYVERVAASLRSEVVERENKHPASWGYARGPDGTMQVSIDSTVTVRLNNMHVCKVQLNSLVNNLNLEAAFRNFRRTGAATPAGKPDGDGVLELTEEEEAALGCDAGFQAIRATFEDAAASIAHGYAGVCARLIHVALWHRPEDRTADMYDLLEPVWDYVISQLDFLTDINTGDDDSSPDLFDDVFYKLAQGLLLAMVEAFERELLHPRKGSHKNHLRPEQYGRVQEGAELCLEFFAKVYNMPKYYLDVARRGPLHRVQAVLQLLRQPTSALVAEYERMEPGLRLPERGDWKPHGPEWEAHRRSSLPYVTPHQLFSLVKGRAHADPDDRAAAKFVHDKDRSLLGRFRRIF